MFLPDALHALGGAYRTTLGLHGRVYQAFQGVKRVKSSILFFTSAFCYVISRCVLPQCAPIYKPIPARPITPDDYRTQTQLK